MTMSHPCKWAGMPGSAAAEAAGVSNPCVLHPVFF